MVGIIDHFDRFIFSLIASGKYKHNEQKWNNAFHLTIPSDEE